MRINEINNILNYIGYLKILGYKSQIAQHKQITLQLLKYRKKYPLQNMNIKTLQQHPLCVPFQLRKFERN